MKYILHFKKFSPAWSEKWKEYILFLKKNHNWEEIDISNFYEQTNVSLLSIIPDNATSILFFSYNSGLKALHTIFDDINKIKIPKNIFFDDVHTLKKYKWDLSYYDKIITSVDSETFLSRFPNLKDKHIHIPHGTPSKSVIKINENPIKKITITGCINRTIYNGRYVAKRLKNRGINNNISSLKHPGYFLDNQKKPKSTKVSSDYYKFLNNHIGSLTSSGVIDGKIILVNKVFEICATGSLLLMDKKSEKKLNKLGFSDMENMILYDETSMDDINDKINFIINDKNKELIDKIRKKGQDLTLEKHLTIHRANLIDSII
ncbi:MAG: hypothetical protein CMF62_00305 [Magnetococcales bacterium]|nr:hypothetical protein [Magnetococcales bacterium]|tara:strand:- start:11903 stop:12856 length:954 start_codon:yes stop_codon:yes gene_type:complete